MAYQFYQNAKMVQNQVGQSEDAVNQSIQNSIAEYKQNFAQANYAYAVNLAQEETGKAFEKMTGMGELLGGIPATFNVLKKGATSAKTLVNKIRGEPTPDKQPTLTDDTSKPTTTDTPTPVSEGPTDITSSGINAAPAGESEYTPDPVDPATGQRPAMDVPSEPDIGSTGERIFDNPLFGEDLGTSTFADQVTSDATRQQFGSADYTGTQASSEPTPVLPTEEEGATGISTQPSTEVPTETPSTITTDTPAPTNILDKTGSDIITSSVQETAGNIEKAASKSIWEEIGDAFADIGAAALDIVDPIGDVVEAGVAIAGVALGAKAISDSSKPTDITPPTMQTQSLLQTSSISAVSQPGI